MDTIQYSIMFILVYFAGQAFFVCIYPKYVRQECIFSILQNVFHMSYRLWVSEKTANYALWLLWSYCGWTVHDSNSMNSLFCTCIVLLFFHWSASDWMLNWTFLISRGPRPLDLTAHTHLIRVPKGMVIYLFFRVGGPHPP